MAKRGLVLNEFRFIVKNLKKTQPNKEKIDKKEEI